MDRAIEEEIDFYKSNLDKLDDADAPIIEEEPLEGTKAQGFFYSWLGWSSDFLDENQERSLQQWEAFEKHHQELDENSQMAFEDFSKISFSGKNSKAKENSNIIEEIGRKN